MATSFFTLSDQGVTTKMQGCRSLTSVFPEAMDCGKDLIQTHDDDYDDDDVVMIDFQDCVDGEVNLIDSIRTEATHGCLERYTVYIQDKDCELYWKADANGQITMTPIDPTNYKKYRFRLFIYRYSKGKHPTVVVISTTDGSNQYVDIPNSHHNLKLKAGYQDLHRVWSVHPEYLLYFYRSSGSDVKLELVARPGTFITLDSCHGICVENYRHWFNVWPMIGVSGSEVATLITTGRTGQPLVLNVRENKLVGEDKEPSNEDNFKVYHYDYRVGDHTFDAVVLYHVASGRVIRVSILEDPLRVTGIITEEERDPDALARLEKADGRVFLLKATAEGIVLASHEDPDMHLAVQLQLEPGVHPVILTTRSLRNLKFHFKFTKIQIPERKKQQTVLFRRPSVRRSQSMSSSINYK